MCLGEPLCMLCTLRTYHEKAFILTLCSPHSSVLACALGGGGTDGRGTDGAEVEEDLYSVDVLVGV